jgi:hypothetical protein
MTSTSDDDELSSVPNQLDARGWMIDACLNAYKPTCLYASISVVQSGFSPS